MTYDPQQPQSAPPASATGESFEKIRVMVETTERIFRGYIYKPVKGTRFRLSDHLNSYGKEFLCLTDVQVNDRGQAYRAGEKREFVAISISAITYVTPMKEGEI